MIQERIISMKVIMGNETMYIIRAYPPQVGAESYPNDKFWVDMEGPQRFGLES